MYPYERALLLIRQGRHGVAVEELQRALREMPADSILHALLALALSGGGRHDDALEAAHAAVGLDPEQHYAHYARARVLLVRSRLEEAEEAARTAVRLHPRSADYRDTLACTLLERRRWAEVLEEAERGLELDAGHTGCANLRASALVQLGRAGEAVRVLWEVLSRAPESPHTHANQGWALLEAGRPRPAVEHFREALRLDPQSDWARRGVVAALRARSPAHAALLRYFRGVSRIPGFIQVALVVGSVALLNVLSPLEGSEWVDPLVYVLAPGYVLFLLLSWAADVLSDLLLLLDPLGRHALSREQRMGARVLAGALVPVLGFGVLAFLAGLVLPRDGSASHLIDTAWIGFLLAPLLLLPVAGTLRAPAGLPQSGMAVLTVLLYACAAWAVVEGARDIQGVGQWVGPFAISMFGAALAPHVGPFLALFREAASGGS